MGVETPPLKSVWGHNTTGRKMNLMPRRGCTGEGREPKFREERLTLSIKGKRSQEKKKESSRKTARIIPVGAFSREKKGETRDSQTKHLSIRFRDKRTRSSKTGVPPGGKVPGGFLGCGKRGVPTGGAEEEILSPKTLPGGRKT